MKYRDIFERIYAVRLDRLRTLAECRTVLAPLDHQGLLSGAGPAIDAGADELDDDELLAQLGVDEAAADITDLRHVRTAAEKREAEEIRSPPAMRGLRPLRTLVHSGAEGP